MSQKCPPTGQETAAFPHQLPSPGTGGLPGKEEVVLLRRGCGRWGVPRNCLPRPSGTGVGWGGSDTGSLRHMVNPLPTPVPAQAPTTRVWGVSALLLLAQHPESALLSATVGLLRFLVACKTLCSRGRWTGVRVYTLALLDHYSRPWVKIEKKI